MHTNIPLTTYKVTDFIPIIHVKQRWMTGIVLWFSSLILYATVLFTINILDLHHLYMPCGPFWQHGGQSLHIWLLNILQLAKIGTPTSGWQNWQGLRSVCTATRRVKIFAVSPISSTRSLYCGGEQQRSRPDCAICICFKPLFSAAGPNVAAGSNVPDDMCTQRTQISLSTISSVSSPSVWRSLGSLAVRKTLS